MRVIDEDEAEEARIAVWSKLLPAILEARAKVRSYIDTAAFKPRRPLPDVETNNWGWPATIKRERILAAESDPIDWKGILHTSDETQSGVNVEDLHSVSEFIGVMVERAPHTPAIDRLINVRPGLHDHEARQYRWLEIGALLIVNDIMGRAEATGAESEDELLCLFNQLWLGHLSEQLAVDLIIPILLTEIESDVAVEFFDGIRIEPLSDDLQRSRAELYSPHDEINPFLTAAAKHAVVVPHVTLPARFHPASLDFAEVDLAGIRMVLEACEIAGRSGSCGFSQILARPIGWASRWTHDLLPLQGTYVTDECAPDLRDGGWRGPPVLTLREPQLQDLVKCYEVLAKSKGNVKIAARRSRRSNLRSDLEDRLLDITIGIEAMLGNEIDELTHRLAQRAAAVLGEQFDPVAIYKSVKQIYGIRSSIVHGGQPKRFEVRLGDQQFQVTAAARFILRELLRDHLLRKQWTTDELDNHILRSLGYEDTTI